MQDPPLVIDLDGTLLRSDLLLESGLALARDQPHRVLATPLWLMRGKAALKHALAETTSIDVRVLPYDARVVEMAVEARSQGRKVVLATASHRKWAEQVSAHLGVFDDVLATEAGRNLSGVNKRDALVQSYGERGFDYAGNSKDDLPVWTAAREAIVVSAPGDVLRKAQARGNVTRVIEADTVRVKDWAKALRLHQWLKNLLVFVPLFAAHQADDWTMLFDAIVAFVSFGLCASSVYLLNDLLDLQDDRHHARKKTRPFASGRLSITAALLTFPMLLVTAFGLAVWQLKPAFLLALGCYYGLTLAYSLWLKRRMVVDVVTLAALYTLRILAGAAALAIPLSFWLLAFSMFIFLSLALVKRYAELLDLRKNAKDERARGRGYFAADLPMIAALGAASGYLAVMVLALYINDRQTAQLYRQPELIWLACPLLLTWITRVWMLAHRGQMHDDPVVFALRDRVSLGMSALIAIVFWAAT